ncbi:MAG: hypothetical protein J4F36_10925 [Nitrosopumilaceae archaeon]|nr:hypothetical protein [Nitrosopumilaceae archaeon]
MLDSCFDFTNAQIFLVISLGAIGFLPKICSAVSFLPAKLIAYPPKVFFFVGLALLFDFALERVFVAFDFVVVFLLTLRAFFFCCSHQKACCVFGNKISKSTKIRMG